jgi:hypothetical protein
MNGKRMAREQGKIKKKMTWNLKINLNDKQPSRIS